MEAEDAAGELYAAISERDWPLVREQLRERPELAAVVAPNRVDVEMVEFREHWQVENSDDEEGSVYGEVETGGNLPLCEVMHCQPPLDVVVTLLRAHPDGASTRDTVGTLPLHLAAAGGASLEVVVALLEAHPAAASTEATGPDGGLLPPGRFYAGWLPLHSATLSDTPASIDVVAALLAAHPEGASARTSETVERLEHSGALPDLSAYPPPEIKAALKAAGAARRVRAVAAWRAAVHA